MFAVTDTLIVAGHTHKDRLVDTASERHLTKAKPERMRLLNFKIIRPNTLVSVGRAAWMRVARCSRSGRAIKLALLAVFCIATPAAAQYTGITGSVPSGPASSDVIR